MKIAVDVRKVIQEIDLDTGTMSNYLVFQIGDLEHKVPATEAQLQQAIYEASIIGENAVELVDAPVYTPQIGAVGEIPAEPVDMTEMGFVDELLQEPLNDDDVSQALRGPPVEADLLEMSVGGISAFAEVNEPVTEEEMAEYVGEGAPVHPLKVNVVSDDGSEDGASFAEIMERPNVSNPNAPPSPTQQRQQTIAARHAAGKPKGQREAIKALRAKARALPPRSLLPHQVDEAGNPIVPQTRAPGGLRSAIDPNNPTVRHAPALSGLGGDDDGFEQG